MPREPSVLLAAVLAACGPVEASPPTFLKGQLHLHSDRSGDSRTPPSQVARWYEARGYDFIVFTDHERVTDLPTDGRLLVIPGVELTQNLATCEPPPEPGLHCLLHVNALFVRRPFPAAIPWGPERSRRRTDLFARALDVARALGGLAQLNHPNFHYAADAPLIAGLARRGLRLVEIANEAIDSNNAGDDGHPGTEALWDAVLATGAMVYGVATDDAHHYDDAAATRARGEVAHTGDRGFVMVRARRDPASIRAAIERGDFYASTGVLLGRVQTGRRSITIEVASTSPGPHEIVAIGRGGRVLERRQGRGARFALGGAPAGTVRVVVRDRRGRSAWVQPVRVP